MKYFNNSKQTCLECDDLIESKVFQYSVEHFEVPLCRKHQDWLRDMKHESTEAAIRLYFELKKRGVPAELEKDDGYKSIDIAVTAAKVNIEVDGAQHNFNHKQALADLKRTYYSFKKGYFTLRIPNSLVKHHLEDTSDFITEILNVGVENKTKKPR